MIFLMTIISVIGGIQTKSDSTQIGDTGVIEKIDSTAIKYDYMKARIDSFLNEKK